MVRMVCIPRLNVFNQLARVVDESSKLIVWVHVGYLFIEELSIGLEPLPSLLQRFFARDLPPKFGPGRVREFCRDEGPERTLSDGTETSSCGPDYLQVASSGYGTVAAPEPSALVLASLAVILLGSMSFVSRLR